MFIKNTQIEYKQYQDFEKYAKFLCNTFDVNIQLESSLAQTDGKTIFLPNVMSMTQTELDMLYAILLHEIGHIKHSSFTVEDFKMLKSENHAFLANCIEDARIENLLIKDFGGGHDIFSNLYCKYAINKNLMNKIFKTYGRASTIFSALGFYIHNLLVNCNTPDLSKMTTSICYNKVMQFSKKYNIEQYVLNAPMKNWIDVVDLTNHIYALFEAQFVDKSPTLSIQKEEDKKNSISNKLEKLKSNIEQREAKRHSLEENISEKEKELSSHHQALDPQLSELNLESMQLQYEMRKLNNDIKIREQISASSSQIAKLQQQISALPQSIKNTDSQIKNIQEKISNNKNGRGTSLTDEAIKKLQEQLKSKQDLLDKKKNSQVEKDRTLNEQERNLSQSIGEPQNFPEKELSSLISEYEALCKKNVENIAKTSEIEGVFNKTEAEIETIQEELLKIEQSMQENAASEMMDIDKMMKEMGSKESIMPATNYQDVWPEAAAAQDKFDKMATNKTGKAIKNGERAAGMFGSNTRDILTFIDLQKEKVKNIDLAEIFKDKIHSSKLDIYNDTIKQKNSFDDKSVIGIRGTVREHIPLTTIFDHTKNDFVGNQKEVEILKNRNKPITEKLKNVFKDKFKFSKKDFWKGGQEDGKLDVRNLWKLPSKMGDDFFEINQRKPFNKVSAIILIDVSGSQEKEATNFGERIKDMSIILSEALDFVHIDHEIIGYHAPISHEMRNLTSAPIYTRRSNELEHIVYKTITQKDKSGICNIETHMSDNSDGESLRFAINRVVKHRSKSKMVFVISDGKPFLSDTDISVLDSDLLRAMNYAKSKKVFVLGLGFFEQIKQYYPVNHVADNFHDMIDFFKQTNFLKA